jgi:hypothetical protein
MGTQAVKIVTGKGQGTMSNYYLPKLQAKYRQKILANGFTIERISDEEFEDGIGACVGNNYVKGNQRYAFDDALDAIGEYDNYRAAISVECAKLAEQSRRHFATKDWSRHVSPVDEGA